VVVVPVFFVRRAALAKEEESRGVIMLRTTTTTTTTLLLALLAATTTTTTDAFVAPRTKPTTLTLTTTGRAQKRHSPHTVTMVLSDFDPETGLRKFRWNLNYGRMPWGFAPSGEMWNGRVAMLAFVWVTLQELVTGQGVITAFQKAQTAEDLIVPVGMVAAFFLCVAALTIKIATAPDDSLSVERAMDELADIDAFIQEQDQKYGSS